MATSSAWSLIMQIMEYGVGVESLEVGIEVGLLFSPQFDALCGARPLQGAAALDQSYFALSPPHTGPKRLYVSRKVGLLIFTSLRTASSSSSCIACNFRWQSLSNASYCRRTATQLEADGILYKVYSSLYFVFPHNGFVLHPARAHRCRHFPRFLTCDSECRH